MNILISTLTMQEAQDSSDKENIFTTSYELFLADTLQGQKINQVVKEVIIYRNAFWESYQKTRVTAARYLNELTGQGFVSRHEVGRTYCHLDEHLVALIQRQEGEKTCLRCTLCRKFLECFHEKMFQKSQTPY